MSIAMPARVLPFHQRAWRMTFVVVMAGLVPAIHVFNLALI
jgi:hypothetical protein